MRKRIKQGGKSEHVNGKRSVRLPALAARKSSGRHERAGNGTAPLVHENPERGLFGGLHAEEIPGHEAREGRAEAVGDCHGRRVLVVNHSRLVHHLP